MSKKEVDVIRWFFSIRDVLGDDLEKNLDTLVKEVTKAEKYYLTIVEDGQKKLSLNGELFTMLAEQPGLLAKYRCVHVDAQQARILLEMHHKVLISKLHIYYMTDEEAKAEYGALKTTEASKLAEVDEVVLQLGELVRSLANVQHALESICEGFDSRGINLSKLSDLRVAGIEESWISPIQHN